MGNVNFTESVLSKHKISEEEYGFIRTKLNRDINLVELGIFSAMWSEHCSYKSTKVHLSKMHTEGSCVIQGPGENAGVIDVGDDDVCVFKMESHNHPSFIEPFSGASTGVGGIMRDIFTMGARPIAFLNSIRFGEFSDKKTQTLIRGVVSGISYYGNCTGIPMLAGECEFDKSYSGNNLVNAMCVGVAKKDKVFYSAATKVGAKILYFGSKTGKDGIHGASMSSDSFSDTNKERQTVQVGDAFEQKLLLEACLDMMEAGCVSAIQDMGAAGLTCSLVEMAFKGNTGVFMDIGEVPRRAKNMTAYEVMLSESQERMLMTLTENGEERAFKILEKYGIDYAIIGEITDSKNLIITENNEEVCSLPINILTDEAPIYKREYSPVVKPSCSVDVQNDGDALGSLKKILSCPNIASKHFIWEQYDTGVRGKTVQAFGESAGVVMFGDEYEVSLPTNIIFKSDEKIPFSVRNFCKKELRLQELCSDANDSENSSNKETPRLNSEGAGVSKIFTYKTQKGLAVSSDCTPRYVSSNPRVGAMQAVVETYRNIAASGAKPLAITNCLNFGNPTNPEIMGQIVESIEGISEAAKVLDYPVVSGNVSLFNETNGSSINPTPVIGGVGLIKDSRKSCTVGLKDEEDLIFIVGDTFGHMENTIYASEIKNIKFGNPPEINLEEEKLNAKFIISMIDRGFINACNDISSGGIAVSLSKMAINSKKWQNSSNDYLGVTVDLSGKMKSLSLVEFLFSEDQGRYAVTVPKALMSEFLEITVNEGVIATQIGFTCKDIFSINGDSVSVSELSDRYHSIKMP